MNFLFDDPAYQPGSRFNSMLATIDTSLKVPKLFRMENQRLRMHYAFGFQELLKVEPLKDSPIHIMTNGEIDLTSFVVWLYRTCGTLRRVLICAWSFGQIDVFGLRQMVCRGELETLDVIGSDMHPKKHLRDHSTLLEMQKNGELRYYSVAPVHAKLILCETCDGRKIVVNSTANSTLYSCVEISYVTEDDDLYDYYNNATRSGMMNGEQIVLLLIQTIMAKKNQTKTTSTVYFLETDDSKKRTQFALEMVSNDQGCVRISIDEIRLMLNHVFFREADAIAMAAAVNLMRNCIRINLDVVMDIDTTIPIRYMIIEGQAIQMGAKVIHQSIADNKTLL